MTNRELAERDEVFRKACEDAGVYPSRQQYRKWKWHRGAAFRGQIEALLKQQTFIQRISMR